MKVFKLVIVVVALVGLAGWTVFVLSERGDAEEYQRIMEIYEAGDYVEASEAFAKLAEESRSPRIRRRAAEMAETSRWQTVRDPRLGMQERVERFDELKATADFPIPEEIAAEFERYRMIMTRQEENRRRMEAAQPALRVTFEQIKAGSVEARAWETAFEELEALLNEPLMGYHLETEVRAVQVEVVNQWLTEPDLPSSKRNELIEWLRPFSD